MCSIYRLNSPRVGAKTPKQKKKEKNYKAAYVCKISIKCEKGVAINAFPSPTLNRSCLKGS